MDTRRVEFLLSKKYGYKPLPGDLSSKYRNYFRENIPDFLSVSGGEKLLSVNGTPICNSYDRIAIGDYGAFIEFSEPATEFICQPGQEYRMNDSKYMYKVKYDWLTVPDNSNIKIYKQKRTVTYADYKAGKYYVSVHEVLKGD